VNYLETYRADCTDHMDVTCDCGSTRIKVTDWKAGDELGREFECLDCGKTEQAKHVTLDAETRQIA